MDRYKDLKDIIENKKDANSLIQFVKDHPEYKMDVFSYVALSSSGRSNMVRPLLNSGLYTPKEIYGRTYALRYYDEGTIKLIEKFTDPYWQNQPKYSPIISRSVFLSFDHK